MARTPRVRRYSTSELSELVDRVVESRYRAAVEDEYQLRREQPLATPAQLSEVLIKRAQRKLAVVAAVSGGAAASPGLGTAAVLATVGLDAAWTMSRLAELIMAIGVAHDHHASTLAERKSWVLAALAISNGAHGSLDELSGAVGTFGGIKALRQLGPSRLEAFNSRLVAKLATRLLVRDSLLSLGNIVPFGIGAGIGATGNAIIARSVGRSAIQLFSTTSPTRRRTRVYQRAKQALRKQPYEVIDVDAEEVDVAWMRGSGPTG